MQKIFLHNQHQKSKEKNKWTKAKENKKQIKYKTKRLLNSGINNIGFYLTFSIYSINYCHKINPHCPHLKIKKWIFFMIFPALCFEPIRSISSLSNKKNKYKLHNQNKRKTNVKQIKIKTFWVSSSNAACASFTPFSAAFTSLVCCTYNPKT